MPTPVIKFIILRYYFNKYADRFSTQCVKTVRDVHIFHGTIYALYILLSLL
jgi:hypothetical protein